jgi:gas vesicle protein
MSPQPESHRVDDPRGPSRRDLLLAAGVLALAARGLPYLLPVSTARAQGATAMSALSASQRAVFDSVLYDNAKDYVAFARVVQDNLRGSEAVAAFDRIRAETVAAGELITAFNDALSRGIAIDFTFLPSPDVPPATLPAILQQTIPRIGLPETLARGIDGGLGQGIAAAASVEALIGTVRSTVPIVAKDISDIYWRAGLTLLAARDDMTGLIAVATAALATAGGDARAIAEHVSKIASAVSGIAASGSGQGFNYAAAAQGLTTAISELGQLLHMNRATVEKVNQTVNVVGSVLTGAATGAAFGPIGAAVGAVAGLLGGLLGGRGGDGTGKALAQISNQIAQMEQHVLTGLQQLAAGINTLSQQISALSQQIDRDFAALSAQMAAFQEQMENRLDQLRMMVAAEARSTVANLAIQMIANARAYDERYRGQRLGAAVSPTVINDPLRDFWVLRDNMHRTPGGQLIGYCGPAFVGASYGAYVSDLSSRIAGRTPAGGPPRALTSWMRLSDNFDPPATPPLLAREVAALATRLRHNRYAIAEGHDGNSPIDPRNGAGIVQGLQQQCFDLLGGIAAAPEYASVSKNWLLPTGGAAPDPLAPQDISDVLASVQSAVSEISDSEKAAALANDAIAFMRPRLAAHYLLTGQNLLPALLYVRRRALRELADSALMVFCNPYMAAVQAFRRMVNTRLSDTPAFPRRANHSQMRIASNVDAQGLIWNYRRSEQPLSGVAKIEFTLPRPQPVVNATSELSITVESIFNGRFYLPGAPSPTSDPADWTRYGVSYFGARLPAVVAALSEALPGPKTLAAHLTTIRERCLLVGIIEQCLKARLAVLAAVPGAAPSIPQLDAWFGAFQEYATIATFALAQPPVTTPGRPAESNMGEAVVSALLGSPANIPFPPSAPAEEAKVYITNVGVFWGWGAEQCRPDAPPAPELIAAVLRKECAFAGENDAVMTSLGMVSELQEALQIARSRTALRGAVNRAGGIASLLRTTLQNA